MSTYTREAVELLVPTIWDRHYAWGMVNERQPEGDMPRAPRGKKNSHQDLWAHLADIRRAWDRAPLTRHQKQAVLLCGGMGLTHVAAGVLLGIRKQSVREAYECGIGHLCDSLNGTDLTNQTEEDDQ